MGVFYDDKEMTKKEMHRQIKDRADRIRDVSREEARAGTTVSDENDLHFFKER